jgi:DNA-binding transcriptional ArsR family regulator
MPDELLTVISEPSRRRLLELLMGGERSVNDLASHFSTTRSAISQHLGALAAAGLVEARKEGRFRFYRVAPSGLAALRSSLEVFWSTELQDLAERGAQIGARKSRSTTRSTNVNV